MKSLAIDPETNDLVFDQESGDFQFVYDNDTIVQKIKILLGTNLGEIDWNPALGFPQQSLIMNGNNEQTCASLISDYLAKMLGVAFEGLQIVSFAVDQERRVTDMDINVQLDGSTIPINLGDVINAT